MDLTSEPAAPKQLHKVVALLVGMFTLLYIAGCLLANSYGTAFFAIPLFVGFVAGLVYPRSPFLAALYALLLALLLSILTLREGVICVLFSLPVLLPMLWLGAFVGSVALRHLRSRRAQNSGAVLALLLGLSSQAAARFLDVPSQHPVHSAESELEIAAAPEEVFAALTAAELRVESRWPWFMRIGLPMPDRMLVEQGKLGGRVRFDFSQGTAYGRITQWEPGRRLAYGVARYEVHDLPFHITRLGRGPDYGFRRERVEDWLTILDTRYTLTPSARGGTLLSRRVVWRRHLAPDIYFGWLQQTVMERGQLRLLELVRQRVTDSRARAAERLAAVEL